LLKESHNVSDPSSFEPWHDASKPGKGEFT
jgi:hypothetical protein